MAAPKVPYGQVIAIREERAQGGWTVQQIADRYGLAPMTVSMITTGDSYKDIPGPITPKTYHQKRTHCARGHRFKENRRGQGRSWHDCKKCHTIRNREYLERKEARAQ
jgi:hypothetical protein